MAVEKSVQNGTLFYNLRFTVANSAQIDLGKTLKCKDSSFRVQRLNRLKKSLVTAS